MTFWSEHKKNKSLKDFEAPAITHCDYCHASMLDEGFTWCEPCMKLRVDSWAELQDASDGFVEDAVVEEEIK